MNMVGHIDIDKPLRLQTVNGTYKEVKVYGPMPDGRYLWCCPENDNPENWIAWAEDLQPPKTIENVPIEEDRWCNVYSVPGNILKWWSSKEEAASQTVRGMELMGWVHLKLEDYVVKVCEFVPHPDWKGETVVADPSLRETAIPKIGMSSFGDGPPSD